MVFIHETNLCFFDPKNVKNPDFIGVFRGCIFFMQPFWWERVDSDHRSKMQQIYSLSPLATRERSQIIGEADGIGSSDPTDGSPVGAGERSRTINLLITNQLLCH